MIGAMSLLKVGAPWTANGDAPSNVVKKSQKPYRFFTGRGLGWLDLVGLGWIDQVSEAATGGVDGELHGYKVT